MALARALGRPPVVGLLAMPLALNANLYYGFIAYCWSVVVLLWALALLARHKDTIAFLPKGPFCQWPVELRCRMIVVLVVAVGSKHQQAEQKVITGEKSARADDFAPAIIVDEAFAQNRIGIG